MNAPTPRSAWSGALTVASEPASSEITAGVRYMKLTDATTQTIGAEFEDNDALAFGVRLTQRV